MSIVRIRGLRFTVRLALLEGLLAVVLSSVVTVSAAPVEEVVQIPVEVADRFGRTHQQAITVTIFRDDAREQSPWLLINHGRSGTAEGRAQLGRARYSANSAYFVHLGFAVFVPTRMGYGITGGPDVENTGPCEQRDHARGFAAAAAQSVAVIAFARMRPYVTSAPGVIVGQSYGGATATALAARNLEGVAAALNFAGGSGGNPRTRPGNPCSEAALAQVFADYGRTARTPMLWLYSENDRFWGPEHPKHWFERFTASGGRAEYIQLPAVGDDGHGSFTRNAAAWKPHVERFLARHLPR